MSKNPKKEVIQSPKGMHDLLPDDFKIYEKVIEKSKEIAEFYGFLPIATPHLEHTELFLRPLGETSDVVEKEMYTLRTKGGDSLVLRPEGTAPIIRSYAENGMVSWPHPIKLYYYGSFFRHENPQKGRLREFRQFGIEVLGDTDPIIDAIIIKIPYIVLSELGFKNVIVHINSLGDKNCRPVFKKELLNFYKKKFNYLCKDCKRRFKESPFRLLDCKEESCIEIKSNAPQMIDYLCDECKEHFKSVLEFLDEGKIPYSLDNYLVRGFDYYGKTVFEIFSKGESSNAALCGGGRYDDLMAFLGGKPLPSAGCALGVDRVIHEMKKNNLTQIKEKNPDVFLIQIGPAAKKRSFVLIEELRNAGVFVSESLSKDNFRAQLKIASKIGCRIALIIGQKEAMDGTVIVKDMLEETQDMVTQEKLVEKIKSILKSASRGGKTKR